MSMTIYYLPTWRCSVCNFSQDFDPMDEAMMQPRFPTTPLGKCAACSLGKNPIFQVRDSAMYKVTDNSQKKIIEILGDESADNLRARILDSDNTRPATEQEKQDYLTLLQANRDKYSSIAENIEIVTTE